MTDRSGCACGHSGDKEPRLQTAAVAEAGCPISDLYPSPREMHSDPLPVKNTIQSPRIKFMLPFNPILAPGVARKCSFPNWTLWSLPLSWRWDSQAIPKVLKLHRSLNELVLLLGSSFLNYLISDFPSAPGISCTGAADSFTSYQASLHSVSTPPAFRWAPLRYVNSCPSLLSFLPSRRHPGATQAFCPSPSPWNSLLEEGIYLQAPYHSSSFFPPSCPIHWVSPLSSFYSCWEIRALRLPTCLPLCLLSPVSQPTQGCHIT